MSDIMNRTLNRSCLNDYIDLIHHITGITIDKARKNMVTGRIRKRIRELGLDNYANYLQLIKDNKNEEKHFIDLITTNETYFYRTPKIWDFIATDFIKEYYENHRQKDLQVWSAASSTGEEAHTLSIVLHALKRTYPSLQFKITGTDISPEVVKKAATGLYPKRAIEKFRKLKPELFKAYLRGNDKEGYKTLSEVKSHLCFKTHNLFKPFNYAKKFDLILLRNVLIYFTKEDQKRVLENICRNLSPTGYLIIGESESLLHLDTHFESIMPLVYKLKADSPIEVHNDTK